MKKALSILLAMALLLGVGAVGANALALPRIALPETAAQQSAGLQDLTTEEGKDITRIIYTEVFKAMYSSAGLILAVAEGDEEDTFAYPAALKAGVTDAAFFAAVDGLYQSLMSAYSSILISIDSNPQLETLYRNGTLAAEVARQAAAVQGKTALDEAAKAKLKPEAWDFFSGPFVEYMKLMVPVIVAEMLHESLGEDLMNRMEAALDTDALAALMDQGKWTEAKAKLAAALPAINAILNPSNNNNAGNFVLWGKLTRYPKNPLNWFLLIVCFGWIWMAI